MSVPVCVVYKGSVEALGLRMGIRASVKLSQLNPKKAPIIVFSDIEPIILSKGAQYSRLIRNTEHIGFSTLSCMQ